ncbi:hypothetical protein [Oleiharenicola sp. Vm1]|uniref:hypothetical protein n=1 Tax=Oleiharenicola sp. Vm1 TaxID=3398393 RepID=UPI0039F52F9A
MRDVPGVGIGACVHYELAVLERGRVVERRARKRNLILDQGLNLVASQRWCDLFSYAVVGTGTTPVKRDSGAITFTRAGSTVTASAGFFAADDVGRLFKFDSGEECYITAFTDTQNVTVSVAGTVAASEGTVWYVNQTAHAAEVKRSNSYGVDSGDNGLTYSLGSMVNKRTIIFSAEASPIVYNEIGWSYTATPGANLFGRDIISGGISLAAGQQLKVIVTLTLTVTPQASTAYTNVVAGWSQDGNYNAESISTNFARAISFVNGDGSTAVQGQQVFEPSLAKTINLSTDTTALVAQTSTTLTFSGSVGNKTLNPDTYVTGTFTRTFRGTFAIAEGNSNAIRSLVVTGGAGVIDRIFRVLLNAAETKDSAHTLELVFRLTWGRVLSNT